MRASSGCLFGILIWKKRKEMFFKIIFCKKIFGRRRPRHYLSTTQSKPTELETSLVANGYQTSRLGSFNVALKRAETRMIVHPGRIGERFVNEANMRKKKLMSPRLRGVTTKRAGFQNHWDCSLLSSKSCYKSNAEKSTPLSLQVSFAKTKKGGKRRDR